MRQANKSIDQSLVRNEINGMSRRQFLGLTASALVAGMTVGAGGILKIAHAGGFGEYLKYG